MIYFRGHIQALESHIADLKERLAESEKRNVAIQSLVDQLSYLKGEIGEQKQSNRDLLDRLLAKNNLTPVSEPIIKPPAAEILAPSGAADAEIQDAYKESWIREETQYLMTELGCDSGTARGYAEQQYIAKHQVIK